MTASNALAYLPYIQLGLAKDHWSPRYRTSEGYRFKEGGGKKWGPPHQPESIHPYVLFVGDSFSPRTAMALSIHADGMLPSLTTWIYERTTPSSIPLLLLSGMAGFFATNSPPYQWRRRRRSIITRPPEIGGARMTNGGVVSGPPNRRILGRQLVGRFHSWYTRNAI